MEYTGPSGFDPVRSTFLVPSTESQCVSSRGQGRDDDGSTHNVLLYAGGF